MTDVFKYRMFVQARFDLTPEEIQKYQASKGNGVSPKTWPWRDTGEFVYARRRTNAKEFYKALRNIYPPIKVKAEYVSGREPEGNKREDDVAMRAWRGFGGIMGTIKGAADEVRHFPATNRKSGLTACGLTFSEHWRSNGKPECPLCLDAAIERHPEMKQYL